ncbi:MAG: hypothetical protein ACKO0V_04205 [bacterium]
MNNAPPNDIPVSNLGNGANRSGSGRGCFFYGCLFSAIGLLLMVGGGGLMAFLGVRQLVNAVASVAEDGPRKFPEVQAATADEVAALEKRLQAYSDAMKTDHPPTEPLELSETEVNQLINSNDNLKGMVYIDFEPDLIKGEVSIPLDSFTTRFNKLRGKYLNGEVELTAEITSQGFLDVHLKKLTAGNGKQVDANVVAQIGKENLAKEVNNDTEMVELLSKIEKLEILKDKVRLVPRKAKAGPAADTSQIPPEKEFNDAVDDFRKNAGAGEEKPQK